MDKSKKNEGAPARKSLEERRRERRQNSGNAAQRLTLEERLALRKRVESGEGGQHQFFIAGPKDKHPLEKVRGFVNIEEDDRREAETVLSALGRIDNIVRKTASPHYTLTLVFVTEDQAIEFARKTGWDKFRPDGWSRFLDGLEVAKALGIELSPEQIRFRGQRTDRRLVDEVGIIPQEE